MDALRVGVCDHLGEAMKDQEKVKKGNLEQLLTIEDLCTLLKVGRTTVKLKVAMGEIPSIKIGRQRRFLPEDIHRWLRKQSA